MRMVPVCTGLVQCVELMQEAVVWLYGTLSDTRCTVSPVRLSLIYTMPMLSLCQHRSALKKLVILTTLVVMFIVVSLSQFTTLILKSSPCRIRRQHATTPRYKEIFTFWAVINGPGKVPSASTVLKDVKLMLRGQQIQLTTEGNRQGQ